MNFLEAEWRKLAIINYEIDPEILIKYLPEGTEFDFYHGKCYVSLVGFMFLNTKLLGLSIPFYRNFEEVNLIAFLFLNTETELLLKSRNEPDKALQYLLKNKVLLISIRMFNLAKTNIICSLNRKQKPFFFHVLLFLPLFFHRLIMYPQAIKSRMIRLLFRIWKSGRI
ncbi:DUF2071 domain-containing protein [Chryseobacterium oranimense]|uniref:DUF2071 domain-containing protein n=1 Tax=Chryseobacterium oranimense TaxID=421058 RepID=UPI0039184C4F